MLGYCTHCDTLRAIAPMPKRGLENELRYAPITHDEPDRHRGCGGVAYLLDHHEHEVCDVGVTHACEKCEQPLFEADTQRGAPICPGSGVAIPNRREPVPDLTKVRR